MISGKKTRNVGRYLPIDHAGEGYGWVTPKDGQKFVGIPYQWQSDYSSPFIEVQDATGKVIETVNALNCHAIEFIDG
jgi:hypothetical protein